jgi:ribosomal protein L32
MEVTHIDEADANVSLSELIVVVEGDFVFVDDKGEPVDIALTLIEIAVAADTHHHHIHHHSCKAIKVDITYNGRPVSMSVTPNLRVEDVLLQAIADFGIDPVSAADLVLRLPGTDQDISGSTFIGELVPRGDCTLKLNLLPGSREHG